MKSSTKTLKEQKYFSITSVHKDDLEEIGFDTKNVDDSTMSKLASKMADAYCEFAFWSDLEIISEHLKIPKHNKKS